MTITDRPANDGRSLAVQELMADTLTRRRGARWNADQTGNDVKHWTALGVIVAMLAVVSGCGTGQQEPADAKPSAGQVREIAKQAYIYGFPMVDSYRIQHAFFVGKAGPQDKGAWNHALSTARVFTPADTTVQTPNADTPYTMLGADLRAEPLVLTVPPIEAGRYYSLQFIDGYTYNFDYVGSRTTGNGGADTCSPDPAGTGTNPTA